MGRKKNRAAHGAGSVYQRQDGRWVAQYIYHDHVNNTEKTKYIYRKTQREAQKALTAVLAEIDAGSFIEDSKITLKEWLNIWLNEYNPDVKPLTLKSYRTQIDKHIVPALGASKMFSLKPHQIQKFYNQLSERLSPKTIKNIHGVLHKALKQAVELEYIPKNPSAICKLPRVIKPEITPLDKTQLSAFFEAIRNDSFENIYLIDLFTGMRQSEIIGLTWDCIDFEKGTIYIYRQWQKLKGAYSFTSLKNNKTRTIKPAAYVIELLNKVYHEQLEWRLKAGSVWQNSENFVFTNELGEPLKHETVRLHFKKAVQKAGFPDLRFHDLRHSFAVLSISLGDDVKTVQENLGHHSAAFTLDTYAHVTESMQNDSSERMNNFIKNL